jgi:UDP-N-acetylmuramoyl-L-alanyl-D-glutamate--2,6-diaminopimelate ligase
MEPLKNLIQKILPRGVYRAILTPYHLMWSFYSAIKYGFPAKKLVVIGVTGTKGKSSVTEMVATILEKAGHKVAVSSTIHFKIGETTRPNLYKMTLPGRGFIQKLMREAANAGCTHMVIELTSEGALLYRHVFLSLNALIFTNLEKEHLESHGSMENYFQAKFRLGKALEHSAKRPRASMGNDFCNCLLNEKFHSLCQMFLSSSPLQKEFRFCTRARILVFRNQETLVC